VNIEKLAFDMTRELFQSGRKRVWFDVDPGKGDLWYVDRETFRGYAAAVRDFYPDGSLHLCPIEANNVSQVAKKLCGAGLKDAAVVVRDWASAMLPPALAMHAANATDLLILPAPDRSLCESIAGPNVVAWSHPVEAGKDIAECGARTLIAVLEGQAEPLCSLSLELTCRLVESGCTPRMELTSGWKSGEAYAVDENGSGRSWRHLDAAKDAGARSRAAASA